jgi:SSS family solute:Na+ symporter
MSTIGTHLNLGASYMINDIYKRFFAPHETERHYVAASRLATILVAILSASATAFMLDHGASIATAWKFLLALGAGAGLVFILRWYWWRINAWSEIAAMTAAATISLTLESPLGMPAVRLLHSIDPALALAPLNQDDPHAFAWLMLTTTALTTATWLAVTLLTAPESEATLQAFYNRVRPAALGWRRFAQTAYVAALAQSAAPDAPNEARHPDRSAQRAAEGPPHLSSPAITIPAEQDPQHDPTLRYNFLHWVLGFTLVYAMLFGVGDLLFSRTSTGLALLTLSATCLAALFYSLNRRGWSVWR